MRRQGGGRRTARAAALLLAVLLAGSARPAAATTVVRMATEAQAATADRIFVGLVTAVSSRPKATAPKYFETVVQFEVEETVAGSLPASMELVFSGGEVGGIRQRVGGMPDLTVGERYVVLLEADQQPPLVSPIVGFNQGLYRVVGETRAAAVVRDHAGRPLAKGAGTANARTTASDPTLDDFLETLRAARPR